MVRYPSSLIRNIIQHHSTCCSLPPPSSSAPSRSIPTIFFVSLSSFQHHSSLPPPSPRMFISIINTQYHSTSLYLLFTSTTIIIRSLSFHPFYIFRFTFIFSTSFFTSTSIATHVPFFHRFSILSMRHQIFSGLRTSNLCKIFCIESIYSLVCPCDTKYFRVCGHRIYANISHKYIHV